MNSAQHTTEISPFDAYKDRCAEKTSKQVAKELKSMRAYVQRHSAAYHWHGTGITPPGVCADGDKISALREILEERGVDENGNSRLI